MPRHISTSGSSVIAIAVVAIAMTFTSSLAFADSEDDRLREALRQSIAQTRALEDERAALQARITRAEQEKTVLKAQVDSAQAQVKKVEKQYRDAVDEFNKRLADRDATLDKWKAAYEEAATVARTKEAERAKFEGEATAYKAGTKACQAKNAQLVKIDNDLLARYAKVNFGDAALAREPAIGFKRVEVQDELQSFTDKILDQKEVSCVK